MAREIKTTTERNPSSKPLEHRSRPYASVLAVSFLIVPVFVGLLRIVLAFDPSLMWLVVWCALFGFGVLGPGFAVAYGLRVAKREPLVVAHVAVTFEAFAVAVSLLVLPGWNPPYEGNWFARNWARIVDALTLPGYVVVLYIFAALLLTMTWWLPRTNAFRSATGESETDTGMGALKNLLRGAKLRTSAAVVDEVAVEIPVDHEGVPAAQLRGVLPALDELPGVVRGRSSLVTSDTGGRSTLRLVHTDPHSTWRTWPGLSHPGGLYGDPIRTSYYSTGETQWYSFVKTPAGYVSKVVPGFANPNDVFKGAQGMTGSGKSGESAIENAEIASRRNVALVYIDTAKLLQNAGWILDFCALAAGSKPASRSLFNALRKLGEHRSRVLGAAGVRNFTDEASLQLNRPWVHIYADEFDVAAQSADLEWLATKGRSLGFRISYTLPRAVGDKLSTDVRAATGMWAQFGITQDYDKGFVLSEETIAAGANPEAFGAKLPGVHYLDRCPAVPERLWAIDCRSYQTREDYGDLRRALEAARATFTPMGFPPDELEVLGDIVEYCRPSVVRNGHIGMDEAPATSEKADRPATIAPNPKTPDDDPGARFRLNREDDDMQETIELPDGFEPASLDTGDIDAEYGRIDPREPIPRPAPDGITLPSPKPRAANREQAVKAFDDALIRLAARGVREFGNKDVANEMTVDYAASWISERFTALCEDETLNPPGLKIERLGRGKFMLVRIAEHRNP